MKIYVSSENLKEVITKLEKVIMKNPPVPILNSVLLRAQPDSITAIANNLETQLTIVIEGDTIEPGELLIDKDYFKSIKKISGELEISCTPEKVIIKGNRKFEFDQLLPDNFPVTEKEFNLKAFNIPASEFKESLKIKVMASKEKVRPNITAINIKNNKIMACDGYRLVERKLNIDNTYTKDIMIPSSTIEQLDKLISKKDSYSLELYCSTTGKNNNLEHINIKGNDWELMSKVIEGEYINIDRIIPQDFNIRSNIKSEKILDTLNFTIDIIGRMLKMDITPDKMTLTKENETSSVEENMDVQSVFNNGSIETLTIGFNDKYLLEAVKMLDAKELTFNFVGTSVTAMLITDNNNDIERHLILPVRLTA